MPFAAMHLIRVCLCNQRLGKIECQVVTFCSAYGSPSDFQLQQEAVAPSNYTCIKMRLKAHRLLQMTCAA